MLSLLAPESLFSAIVVGDNPHSQQVTICLLVALLISFVLYQYKKFTFWSSRGIKTPLPLPIVGNGLDLMLKAKRKFDLEWRTKYGKVYGYYIGTNPRLVIADAEILRKICIKDFPYFTNHHFDSFRNEFQMSFLVALKDLHWKRARALMSPTFTSGKIKRMFKLMDSCSDEMVSIVREKEHKVLDVKDVVSLYAMDVITTCCYALKLERAGSDGIRSATSRNGFVDTALNVTKSRLTRMLAMIIVPETILKFLRFNSTPRKYFNNLHRNAADVINKRRASSRNDYHDYLQLLLDAKFGDKMELNDMDDKENHHAGLTEESILKTQADMESEVRDGEEKIGSKIELSKHEIESNVMFLLIVGYETTSTLMAHCLYTLAHHQDIQEKLYEQLKSKVNEKGDSFDYDTVTSDPYLDAVISETLRSQSPVFFMDRVCNQDYYLEKYNTTIPKGTILNLSYFTIMNDPDYWEEPQKFDPTRFLPENRHKIVPGSYCPFGLGPRHCIGYRFSLTESKIGLAKLLLNYRFDPLPGSSFPPEPKLSVFLNVNKDLNVIPRPRSTL